MEGENEKNGRESNGNGQDSPISQERQFMNEKLANRLAKFKQKEQQRKALANVKNLKAKEKAAKEKEKEEYQKELEATRAKANVHHHTYAKTSNANTSVAKNNLLSQTKQAVNDLESKSQLFDENQKRKKLLEKGGDSGSLSRPALMNGVVLSYEEQVMNFKVERRVSIFRKCKICKLRNAALHCA